MYHYTGADRICELCGKKYTPKSHSAKYCSKACKSKVSGKTFRAKNPEYWDAYNKRKAERNKKAVPKFVETRPKRRCKSCKRYHRGQFEFCHICIVRKSNYIAEGCEAMI